MTKADRKDTVLEHIALHALGALDPEERAALDGALNDDAELRAELGRMRAVAVNLALAAPAVPPRPEVRSHLLERVAAEQTTGRAEIPAFFFTREHQRPWEEIGPGVSTKLLTPGVAPGGRALLLRIAPGATVAEHAHPFAEHCYVLSGDVRILGETLAPGDYHRAAAGTRHRDITSASGCLLLIVDGPPA